MEDAWEMRLKNILGDLGPVGKEDEDDDLPMVTGETLETYSNFLKEHLVFPFTASYERESGPFSSRTYDVKVTGLDEYIDDFYGLICSAKIGRKTWHIAMGELEVSSGDPNYRFLDDYNTWFWNYR